MSDPVKNVEVEDVLSSIRRLVSDDKRPAPEPDAVLTAQDRLVLTPALRVMDDPDSEPEIDEAPFVEAAEADDDPAVEQFDARADGAAEAGDDSTEQMDWDQPMGAFEARADDTDAEQSEPQDAPLQLHALITEADDDVEQDDTPAVALDEIEETTEAADTPEEAIQALDDAQSDAVEPLDDAQDLSDGEALAETPTEIEETSDQSDVEDAQHVETAAIVEVVEAELMDVKDASGHTAQAVSLSSKIAALEAVIGGRDDQWEPDDTGDSDYSGTEAPAMTWDDPEPETIEAAVATDVNDFAEAVDFADVLDEETLREMVSDIVREELQGALGERITRNVRKLVRREIHRAMAAQDLE